MRTLSSVLVASLLATAPAYSAPTVTTLSVDFEAPTFQIGGIGGNPPFTTGQGGWAGPGFNVISDAHAHSGTQSLMTTSGGYVTHLLDDSGVFHVGYSFDWWVRAWIYLESPGTDSAGGTMSIANGLGSCPLIQLQGNGVPYGNTCTQ